MSYFMKILCINIPLQPGTTVPIVDCQECHCTWNVDPNTLLYKIQCGFVTCNETCELVSTALARHNIVTIHKIKYQHQ